MRSNFGYLYVAEKQVKTELNQLIAKLKSDSKWAEKVARFTDPSASASDLAADAMSYRTGLFDLERKIEGANISNLRYWRDAIKGLVKAASGPAPVVAAPVVAAPKPAPAPAPAPVPVPKALPPAPPGVKCPHYTKASAFPTNWNDPAAEGRYLKKYPDVKNWAQVMAKRFKGKGLNALWHYRCYGKKEGRTWAGLDGIYSRMPGYLR